MFKFQVEPSDLFRDRMSQMRSWGIPARVIKAVQKNVTDMWKEEPGGWSYEWVKQAKIAEKKEKWLLASACYGAAKIGGAITPYREEAMRKQTECYLKASKQFPCDFERRILDVPYRNGSTPVPAHIFCRPSKKTDKECPIICLSGGVDFCKMEIHRLAVALAIGTGCKVVAIDMPGTGESAIPLASDAEQIYKGVLDIMKKEQDDACKTGIVGISFGGHWAAKLAMQESVDAAINIGGPIGYFPFNAEFLENLPNGMPGIVANALRFDKMPVGKEYDDMLADFGLPMKELMQGGKTAPILAFNGGKDPYIPKEETLFFESYKAADVWIFKDSTHCAQEQITKIVPSMIAWLRETLHGKSNLTSLFRKTTAAILPAREKPKPVKKPHPPKKPRAPGH